MEIFSIYLTGVGGQGIGLLSEVLLRAADHAGHQVKGVDTHGLAQRGGIVVSRIRFGKAVYSPLTGGRSADLGISLERHEALRSLQTAVKEGGTMIYYDAVWQPLGVRLGAGGCADEAIIEAEGKSREIRVIRVLNPAVKDPRMQNMALLGEIDRNNLLPEIETEHIKEAMTDLMEGEMLEKNLRLFSTGKP